MRLGLIFALLMLTTAPAAAQSTPSDSAKKFTLDPSVLQPQDAAATPPASAEGSSEPAADANAVTEATTPPRDQSETSEVLSLDTPIAALLANAHGKAVLDRDLSGLSTDENLGKFSAKSLRQFQPLTGGQLTDAMLGKVEADLAASPTRSKSVDRRRDER